MLTLTRKSDYALLALADLARREPSQVSAREISERARVPLPMLTNILNQLRQAGLVAASRGVQGGYRLARQAENISLVDIIEAIEGPFRFTLCCGSRDSVEAPGEVRPDAGGAALGLVADCSLEPTCSVKAPVRRVYQSLLGFLGQVSLAQIAFDRVTVGLAPVGSAESAGEDAGRPTKAAGGRTSPSTITLCTGTLETGV